VSCCLKSGFSYAAGGEIHDWNKCLDPSARCPGKVTFEKPDILIAGSAGSILLLKRIQPYTNWDEKDLIISTD
jgi:hypothetical protein